eukprot:TRINITY_DN10485_c0_g2_i1.p1 TRINITY_DN10485_c0_g2~~TRINITY_DN10485_c0_g2_i1.p1  ORF type:complete len:550 (+),score=198.12 TRINITY_DN10485_c0_g2_i1:65-1714(+)
MLFQAYYILTTSLSITRHLAQVDMAKRKREEDEAQGPDYLRMILTAPVYDVAKVTPLELAKNMSKKARCNVYLKREDDQQVFSFKLRGAYNKMINLTEEELKKGVLACSAGNHAQGVALAATKLGTTAIICMPTCTPDIKVDSVKRLGGQVVLKGLSFDEAKAECIRLNKETGRPIIHPYDDPHVIAGQGTIAVEIFRQLPSGSRPDVIFTAIGGGGLIAGVTAYTKRVFPKCKVVGVEACDADAMNKSLASGKVITLDHVGLFADGAAVKTPGDETFKIVSSKEHGIDGVVTVSNDEICAAIKDIFVDTRGIVEPAGALSVAGMKKYVAENKAEGLNLVCVTSGANINFNRLRFVAERAEMGEEKEVLMSVVIPEETGAFMRMSKCIEPHNITEFSYRFRSGGKAFILVAFGVTNRKEEVPKVIEALKKHGMKGCDVTDNELAKLHVRYLIGGRHNVPHEKLIRFEFPETFGSLERFILRLQCNFYLSLLHYRNHGTGTGSVLVGIPVPPDKAEEFNTFVNTIGYTYCDETENPVYKGFLRKEADTPS